MPCTAAAPQPAGSSLALAERGGTRTALVTPRETLVVDLAGTTSVAPSGEERP